MGDVADYKNEIERLVACNSKNNFALDTLKTKELEINFWRNFCAFGYQRILFVERVNKIKFLWTYIADDLS